MHVPIALRRSASRALPCGALPWRGPAWSQCSAAALHPRVRTGAPKQLPLPVAECERLRRGSGLPYRECRLTRLAGEACPRDTCRRIGGLAAVDAGSSVLGGYPPGPSLAWPGGSACATLPCFTGPAGPLARPAVLHWPGGSARLPASLPAADLPCFTGPAGRACATCRASLTRRVISRDLVLFVGPAGSVDRRYELERSRSAGKRMTSRIDGRSHTSIARRSIPRPRPAVGGRP